MPAIQTQYDERMGNLPEGMIVNMETKTLISRPVEGAAGIGFGKVAVQGTADNQVKAPTAGGVFRGITVRAVELDGRNGDKYAQYDIASLMRDNGVIRVVASVAVDVGDAAYFTDAGVITNVPTDNTAIPGGTFDTSTAGADELVNLRLA